MSRHSPDLIEAVHESLKLGLTSPDIIAIRLCEPIADIEEIVGEFQKATKNSRSNVEIMRGNLDVLQDLLDTAEWMYRGVPTIDNAAAITSMIQTSLQTIKEIESRKDPVVIMNEILARIIQPLFREFIRYTTIEASQARTELFESLPREHHNKVDATLKSLVKGIGRASSTDYKKTVTQLAAALGCKPEDEKVRSLPHIVSNGDTNEQEDKSSAAN